MSKILVVDDDPALHQLIEGALINDGHTLIHTTDAIKGLEMLAREPIDLALIDYVMPEMDGIEFLDKLRRDHPNLKAIMITAYGTPAAVLGALRKQVCDFLVKPFSLADLRAAISAALDEGSLIDIEVISARPDWVQLRVPCDLAAVPLL
ncbi:MAG: response regulator, partial [Acidobacteria bacterium]|nr:response regulator [Acidobacteriota bacterium]